jgi:hypothetical protein
MGKVSIAVVALGVFVQWFPLVRAPLAVYLSDRGLRQLQRSLSRVVRARLRGACARLALLFVLGTFTILLPALAYGSPPDPSWIPGLYDDADYDDVVILATSASADVAPGGVIALLPSPSLVWNLPELTETAAHGCPACSALPRAPPSA